MLQRTFKSLAAAGFVALTAACGAAPYSVASSPKAFLPQRAETGQPTGLVTVLPDQPMLTTPVGWRSGAALEQNVAGVVGDKPFAFEAGEALAVASISGTAGAQLPPGTVAMCGIPRTDVVKNLLVASTLGMSSIFNKTGSDWQVCLLDTDRDAKVEKAILAGVTSERDAVPVGIAPTPYQLVSNAVMPGESEARIVYRGKTGMIGGHVSFDLQVEENGAPLVFTNIRTKVDIEELPKRVTLMGAEFTVRSYDPADGSAEIDVHRGFVPGNYGLQTYYTTQYIPIYVPR